MANFLGDVIYEKCLTHLQQVVPRISNYPKSNCRQGVKSCYTFCINFILYRTVLWPY